MLPRKGGRVEPEVIDGWTVTWVGPRTVRLEKDTEAYRKWTGAVGFVETTGDADMPRAEIVERALACGKTNDDLMEVKTALPERSFTEIHALMGAIGFDGLSRLLYVKE
jgi:hypothetical protein